MIRFLEKAYAYLTRTCGTCNQTGWHLRDCPKGPAMIAEARAKAKERHPAGKNRCDVSTVRNAGGFSYRKCATHNKEWSDGGPCPVGGSYA